MLHVHNAVSEYTHQYLLMKTSSKHATNEITGFSVATRIPEFSSVRRFLVARRANCASMMYTREGLILYYLESSSS